MPTQAKIAKVAEIEEMLQSAQAMWLVDYRGLTVKKTEKLRRALREADAEVKIYKNNLVRIALANLEQPEMDEYLAGPNAFVFAKGDVAASAKVLKAFAKENKEMQIVGGLIDGRAVDAEQVKAIADLPSREQLVAQLLGVLNNPATKIVRVLNEPMACFARAVKQIAEKKEEAA